MSLVVILAGGYHFTADHEWSDAAFRQLSLFQDNWPYPHF